MLHYFSDENLSFKNGTSATISMKTWFLFCLLGLFNIIPVLGTLVWLIIYITLGIRAETAPSIRSFIRLQLLVTVIAFILTFIIFIAVAVLASSI